MVSRFLYATLVILGLAGVFGHVSLTQAETVTSASYTVSRHAVSAGADHECIFTTPSGIGSITDTVTLQYPSGFSLSGIMLSDIDLSYGPITGLEQSATLAASAAAGTWGVTIGASSIQFSPPTDAAPGLVATHEVIRIRIGTNATGGTGHITNPSSAGTVAIRLAGGFGDVATMSVPIVSRDDVTVTATVAAPPCTTNCGGGGGSVDVTPPVLSGIQVSSITTTTASILWTTDEAADSMVAFGLTSGYGNGTVSNSAFVTGHTISLTSLTPNTTYHFQVSSRDQSGNQTVSGDFTFTTASTSVVTPAHPILTGIQVTSMTDTSAHIMWQTDINANSFVAYGLTSAYGATLFDATLNQSHDMTIAGLNPATTYHFIVSSHAQGVGATSSDMIFTTAADQTPPPNVFGFSATPGTASVGLDWTNSPSSDLVGVRIVKKTTGFPVNASDGVTVYDGNGTSTTDASVTAGATYFYAAFAYDASANFASGALAQATVPPSPVVNLVENTAILCSNTMDDDADGAIDCLDLECIAFPSCVVTPTTTPPLPTSTPPLPPEQGQTTSSIQVPTTTTPTSQGEVLALHPIFSTAGGTVELVPDAFGRLSIPVGSPVLASVPIPNTTAVPDKAYLTVGSSSYNLALNGSKTAYQASFFIGGSGESGITISMTFVGGGTAVAKYTAISQFGGQVVSEAVGQPSAPLSGATVTLYVNRGGAWEVWNGSAFNQANPQTSGENGGFLFIVPPGRYYLEITKAGYRKTTTGARAVNAGAFGERVGVVQLPPDLGTGVSSTAPILENAVIVAKNAVEQVSYGATIVKTLIEQPAVQETVENTVSPAVLGVAIANTATALPLFNGLAYLQYLFSQPLLLIGRRRKKKWGIAYNALTKQPVDLAIVRLLKADTRMVIQSRVTDGLGRYSFSAPPGAYVIEAVKPGFAFPTQFLQGQKQDAEYLDLYHGTPIDISVLSMIGLNLPMDPTAPEEPSKKVLWRKRLRTVQEYISPTTVVVTALATAMYPTRHMGIALGVQVATYVVFRRFALSHRTKSWGAVLDDVSKKPVGQVIVRIFDKKFNKVLETQVTGGNGSYGFFVRRNVYYVTAEKAGYQKYVSPDIDLTEKDEAIVDHTIVMRRLEAGSVSSPLMSNLARSGAEERQDEEKDGSAHDRHEQSSQEAIGRNADQVKQESAEHRS